MYTIYILTHKMSPEEQSTIFNFVYDSIEERCDNNAKRIRDIIIKFYDEKEKNEYIFGRFNNNEKNTMLSYLSKTLIKHTSDYYINLFNEYHNITNLHISAYYEFQRWCYYADVDDYINIVKIVMEIERFNQDIKNITQKLHKYRMMMSSFNNDSSDYSQSQYVLRRIVDKIHLLRAIQ